jgi:hypothetical protein
LKPISPARHSGTPGFPAWFVLLSAVAVVVTAPAPVRAAGDPWSAESRWASVRIGSTSSGAQFAPPASVGLGFGYTYFLGNQVAASATVGYDVMGRFGDATEIEIPFTVDFTKHFKFSEAGRPYMGAGLGAIYHKLNRTGDDASDFRQAIYLAIGGNAALDHLNLLGIDFRYTLEQNTRSINNTFPNPKPATHNFSLKFSYSRVL